MERTSPVNTRQGHLQGEDLPMVRIQRKALGVVVRSFKGESGPWEPAPFLEREALPQVRAINVLILVLALRQA